MKDHQEEERSESRQDASSDEQQGTRLVRKQLPSDGKWTVEVVYDPEEEDKIAEEILVVIAELLSGRPVRYVRDGSKQKKTEGQAKGGQTGDKPRKRGGDSQDRSP